MGPWHGEVGYEALYWLPWLEALRRSLAIDPARWVPVTRGGMGLLYDAPVAHELYQYRTAQDVRVANWLQATQSGWMKQRAWSAFDRSLIADVRAAVPEAADALVLHPAWMYAELGPFLAGHRGPTWWLKRTRYPPIPAPTITGVTLPKTFVAVRFYVRPTFPATPMLIQFARETIKQVAAHAPVIVMTSGLHVDDHVDYLPTDRTNVTVLSEVLPMTLQNNLAIQAAILGQAAAFVGTYGGFAQLALRLGRPVLSFYDAWHSTALAHKHLSDWLAVQQGIPFHVLQVGQIPLLQDLIPRVLAQTGSSRATADAADHDLRDISVAPV